MLISQIAVENEGSLKNLREAFKNESNAQTKYMAYAAEADCDGFHGVASLLRATARSEQVTANNHARVIQQLGGEPEAQIRAVEVKATLENLRAALSEKIYEVDSIYPRFLAENGPTDNSAGCTLTWGIRAKRSQAGLLSEAIMRMEAGSADLSIGAPHDFYVRSVCGYVSNNPEPERCWVCNHFCGTFETIR
jgi:rubrerythrin